MNVWVKYAGTNHDLKPCMNVLSQAVHLQNMYFNSFPTNYLHLGVKLSIDKSNLQALD